MALSFPDPIVGTVIRPTGQGCVSCVHKLYCRPYNWIVRYETAKIEASAGTACMSWSTNPLDQVKTINQDDLDYNNYINEVGIAEETTRGLDDAITGDANKY